MTEMNAADNPALANDIIDQVLKAEPEDTTPESGVAFTDLPDTTVTLPGGFLTLDGDLIREAEVKELTGYDEEIISRAGTTGKVMMTILKRALVRVGDMKVDEDLLNTMLAGDRDYVLLAIRKATFGDTVDIEGRCPHCDTEQTLEIDLGKDVEVKTLEGPEDRQFTVKLRNGKEAKVTLPSGRAQRLLLTATDKTVAELNTILLRWCVESIDEMPVINENQIRALGLSDREKITEELTKRNPGPRLTDIKKACPSCGEEIDLPLTLAGLFRL